MPAAFDLASRCSVIATHFEIPWSLQLMKRTWTIALFAVTAVAGTFAQSRKASKAGARQQLVDPPVAPAMPAHPSSYRFAGVPYPRIEAGNRVTFVSPGTAHEWQTWRRSLYAFAPLLFRNTLGTSQS